MDLWSIMFVFILLSGLIGFIHTPFWNAVLWYCDWREGAEINWGLDFGLTFLVPFCWMFAIIEIMLLFSR